MTPTPDTIHTLLSTHGQLTFRHLAAHLAQPDPGTPRLSRHTLHTSIRAALRTHLTSGHITCWSISKPYYLLTEHAPRIRTQLKTALLSEIMRAGELRPRDLKSIPIHGELLPMDLLSTLCDELIHEQLIVNVGRRIQHSAKVFRAAPLAWQLHQDPITLETPLVASTLRHLVALASRQLTRESAANIARVTRQPLLAVKRALSFLQGVGYAHVTARVGAMELFGYALADVPVQRVTRLTPGAPVLLPDPRPHQAPSVLEAPSVQMPAPAPVRAPQHTRVLQARLRRPQVSAARPKVTQPAAPLAIPLGAPGVQPLSRPSRAVHTRWGTRPLPVTPSATVGHAPWASRDGLAPRGVTLGHAPWSAGTAGRRTPTGHQASLGSTAPTRDALRAPVSNRAARRPLLSASAPRFSPLRA